MATTKRNQKSIHKVETVSQQEDTKQAAGEVLKVLPSEYAYLSEEQLKLLSTLSDEFVGVYALSAAKQFRLIEREQAGHGHKLVEFAPHVAVSMYAAHELQPYLSVKIGEDGLKVVS